MKKGKKQVSSYLLCKVCRHPNVDVINDLLLRRREADGRIMTHAEIGLTFGFRPAMIGTHKRECLRHLIDQARLTLVGSMVARQLRTVQVSQNMTAQLAAVWDKEIEQAMLDRDVEQLIKINAMMHQQLEFQARLQGEGVAATPESSQDTSRVAIIVLPTLPQANQQKSLDQPLTLEIKQG